MLALSTRRCAEWAPRLGDVPWMLGADLFPADVGLSERVARRIDLAIDRNVGVLPALGSPQPAQRLPSRAHATGAPEPVPRLVSDRAAAGLGAPRRADAPVALLAASLRLERSRSSGCGARCSAARGRERPEPPGSAVPERGSSARPAGRRLRRELGPHRRQGDRLAAPRTLRRPERRHARRPRRATTASPSARIVVTGWPQTDVFHRRRPREAYDAIARALGLDPVSPARARRGKHADERARTRAASSIASSPGGRAARRRASSAALPPPSARPRVARALRRGARCATDAAVQEPSYTDLDVLATLLQHVDCVVANAGTILLDALVNDRPAGLRPLRRGRSARRAATRR